MSKTSWAAPTAVPCSQGWQRIWSARREGWKRAAATRGCYGILPFCHRRLRTGFSKTPDHHDRAVRGRRHLRRDRAHRRRADGQGARAADRDRECRRRPRLARAGGGRPRARAARAEPDGYTIAIGNAGTSAAAYTIYPMLPFKPDAFAPIAVVAKTFGLAALRRDFPAKTVQEFIAYAKSNPGKINLGHAGVGSSNFLICKSFVQAAGIEVTLVGYRGAAPALTDAIGGQIDGVCDSAASVSQAIDDKLVKGLVVGSTVRLSTLPDLPMSSEAGLPEFEAQGWNGLFAPKGTPPEIIAKLNAAARTAVESEAVKKRFHDLSSVPPDAGEHTPEVLQQLVTRDVEKYRKLLHPQQ